MKVLVCVSIVPDTTSEINFLENNTKIDIENVQFILNPHDEYCLSRAIMLKSELESLELTVINVGGDENEGVIRRCIAMGADKAVRIDGKNNSSNIVAKKISAHINDNEYDLIFFGKESIDFNGNCVHGIVSGITGIPLIANVIGFDLEGEEVLVKSETGNSIVRMRTKIPIMISGQRGIVSKDDIIIPNMRGLIASRQKEIEIMEYEDREDSFSIKEYKKVSIQNECEMIDADNLEKLIDILKKERAL